ncbi:50S ribosomal protein L40e [Candidatus Woesearchaeota archaeon]|nr:50S ribosomal protein L40e [Candidatus Woesearchaeota archaeon]
MAKFPEAEARFFHGVYVCRRCKSKIRSSHAKILAKKITCRSCGSKSFRTVRKK